MNNFTIKDIERLSGIKAHTLRVWELRHGLYLCKRKESSHRFYDNEDLKEILRIALLYHRGLKVSKIAALSKKEINDLATSNIDGDNQEMVINQMIECTLDLDQSRFETIIRNAQQHFEFEQVVSRIYHPFLRKMGLLWVTGRVTPAQEHFSSNLIMQHIILALQRLPMVIANAETWVALFAPEGDMHEIPLLVMHYVLKKNGIKSVYFGGNTSLSELAYYHRHKPLTHLVIHLVTNFTDKEPQEYVDALLQEFPREQLILAGPAFASVQSNSPQVRIVKDMDCFLKIFVQ